MNTRKTLSLLALSLSATPFAVAAEFTLFAAGVNPNDISTYYNADQWPYPTCWAAAGSNVVAHWQDHHVENLPEGTPTGTKVYESFLDLFSTPAGGNSHYFYQWWLGYYPPTSFNGTLKENWESLGIGGYYEDIYSWSEIQDMAWLHYTGNSDYSARHASRAIYYALQNGYSFAIGVPNLRHAFTVYGATFDPETELVTSLYLCDSGEVIFKKESMSRARVNQVGNKLCVVGYYAEENDFVGVDNGRYLDNIYFLGNTETETLDFVYSGVPIPEPSAFALLAGLGVLVFAGGRRHRQSREI
ncbi:MAG: PEP-CTERM sorting domain-containing protein [Opitutales bacterium]|nr:PEP-CTERM sorting domain-containing protein [Opitutales bacterium]